MRSLPRPKPHAPTRVVPLTLIILGLAWFSAPPWHHRLSAHGGSQHIEDEFSYSTNPRETQDLVFSDSKHGWILVTDRPRDKSYLYSTSDGGETWASHRAPVGLYKLSFASVRDGWALQMPRGPVEPPFTTLLRTETGGITWSRLPRDGLAQANRDGYILVFLAFGPSQTGWIAGAGPENTGVILKSTDGGKTTHRLNQDPNSLGAPLGIVLRGSVVWIYGAGFTLCSQNAGKTWTPLDPAQFGTVRDNFDMSSGFLLENGHGWLAGMAMVGTILSTEDFGRHWKKALQTTISGRFDAISAWDEEHACAIEGATRMYYTADGGASWAARDVLPKPVGEQAQFFLKLMMLGSGRGWALRAGGYLYQTLDGGRSWNLFDPGNVGEKGTPRPVAHHP